MLINAQPVVVQPLSKKNLLDTIMLAERIFPGDINSTESPRRMFTASIDPNLYREWINEAQIKSLKYWVTVYENRVIAFTGLYIPLGKYEDDLWLGWFGVDSDFRRHGIGRALLQWTMARAKAQGCKTLSLYTSSAPNEAAAQKLYGSLGFKVFRTEQHGEYTYLFRQKRL